ncbi:MAG: hypothetical protein HY554_06960 [Elusimicrobia bacterium]|nr:hypothetical protein [Elusimicrobiota bacterium]
MLWAIFAVAQSTPSWTAPQPAKAPPPAALAEVLDAGAMAALRDAAAGGPERFARLADASGAAAAGPSATGTTSPRPATDAGPRAVPPAEPPAPPAPRPRGDWKLRLLSSLGVAAATAQVARMIGTIVGFVAGGAAGLLARGFPGVKAFSETGGGVLGWSVATVVFTVAFYYAWKHNRDLRNIFRGLFRG